MRVKRLAVAFSFCVLLNCSTAYADWEQQTDLSWKYVENLDYVRGWKYIRNKWYYFTDNGTCVQNMFWNVNGEWYYFNEQGEMLDSNFYVNGKLITVAGSGECNIEKITRYMDKKVTTITTIINGERTVVDAFIDYPVTEEMRVAGDAKLNSIIGRIDRTKSIVNQVNQVTDILSDMYSYSSPVPESPNVNIYNVLNQQDTVCSGYCNIEKSVLDRLGIYSEIVEDVGQKHCWIYFQDGNNKYYTDPTWYDTMGKDERFLARDILTFRSLQKSVGQHAGYLNLSERQVQFVK